MNPKKRIPLPTLAGALAILAVAAVHAGSLLEPVPASAAGRIGIAASGPLTLRLHGSTPTLAWSPDSKRVAVASAFEYYGFGRLAKRHRADLGIYVVDPKTRKHRRVSTDSGYHPLWLDKRTLAWGHSPYELGTPGLYVARLSKRGARVRRVGGYKGVYHTRKTKGRSTVLFYSGWPEYRRWVRANLKTGATTSLPGAPRDSWMTPTAAVSQCLQQVGAVKTGVTATGRFLLSTATQNVQVPGAPYLFYNYNSRGTGRSCDKAGHCGAVLPCLSPNGRWLAYVTHGPRAGIFELRIMAVPK